MPDECDSTCDECDGCGMEPNVIKARGLVKQAIEEAVRIAGVEGKLCTGWFLVAELQGSDGNYGVASFSGDTVDRPLPPWRAEGLVQYVLD